MVIFRRGLVALVWFLFLSQDRKFAGSDVIAPGDSGYEFGALTSTAVSHGFYLVPTLF